MPSRFKPLSINLSVHKSQAKLQLQRNGRSSFIVIGCEIDRLSFLLRNIWWNLNLSSMFFMKNRKLCKGWSKRYVPEDLWPEILSRLPVKSLLRFRSVSKPWLALIDDAGFARLHLNNFRNNSDETHLLVVQSTLRDCVVRCAETFESDSGILRTLGNVYNPGRKGDIVCSVDGLILLSHGSYSESFGSPDMVWNPSIRKFRELPSLPKLDASLNTHLFYFAIGLGYDALAKDYKIVKLAFMNDNTLQSKILHSVAIFSLGANSWKTVKSQGMGGFDWPWGLKSCYQGLYFRGCLYCIAGVRDLVLFDLSSEVLSSISLPNVRHHNHLGEWEHSKCERLALVDGGCTMAAFFMSPEESSIWVLDTESMNWARRYTFQLKSKNVLYLKNNGDMLVLRGRTEIIADENAEERQFVWWDQVGSYSPKTDEYKVVQEEKSPFYMNTDVFGCAESLILHN